MPVVEGLRSAPRARRLIQSFEGYQHIAPNGAGKRSGRFCFLGKRLNDCDSCSDRVELLVLVHGIVI